MPSNMTSLVITLPRDANRRAGGSLAIIWPFGTLKRFCNDLYDSNGKEACLFAVLTRIAKPRTSDFYLRTNVSFSPRLRLT